MARTPMVTRTILTTVVDLVCVNTEDRSVFEQSITLPRTYKDELKMMKAVEKVLDGEPIKALSIEGYEVQKTLYGMTEADFIKAASVLPPRSANKDE